MRLRWALGALLLAAALACASARALQRSEETGGMAAADSLSEVARAVAGDYAPDPNAQVINDDNGGTSVVLSNQNSVHEQTDDTWKIHLVREAQKKTKEENKRKQALEERRKQSYEEANKMDQEEEKHKKIVEQNRQNAQNQNQNQNKPAQPTPNKQEGDAAKADASTKKEDEKASLIGTCTFSKDAACSANFANKGLAGFILRKDQYDKNPFNEGGDFNQGWKWTHPYLCCPSSQDAKMDGMYVMSKACPAGTEEIGFMGALLLKKDYAGNPFTEGGDFNEGWRWTHPVLCKVSDYSKLQSSADWCLFAASCPTGKWVDKSFSGVIIVNQHYDRQPFAPGGQFNPSWKWAHPKLCCRSA